MTIPLHHTEGRLRFGACVLDVARAVLTAPDGSEAQLRPKTLELLRLLLANAGRVVTREQLLDRVWPGVFVTDDSITQCISEIRRAMGSVGPALLRTMPRRGYILEARVEAFGSAAPSDEQPAIAVLPFRCGPGAEPWLADGIIEGIVHVLSGLDRLMVVSRGAALAVDTPDPRLAGHRLGVRYVLSGSVALAGGRLRVTTELADAETGVVLRTDNHEAPADELFALQDRIAENAAVTIAPQLRAMELARARRTPAEALTTYQRVLRALDEMRRMDRAAMLAGRALLEAAIAGDPDDSMARSYLSWWYMVWAAQGWSEDAAADARAAEATAIAALDIDPRDALALCIRGVLLGFLRQDVQAGMGLVDEAVSLRPSLALAWSFGALLRSWVGEGEAAAIWAERGVRLAPLDPLAFFHEHVMGQAQYVAGDFEASIRWSRASLARQPKHQPSLRALVAAKVAAGRLAEARVDAARLLELDPAMRVSQIAARTPLAGHVRDAFVERLHQAGLPD